MDDRRCSLEGCDDPPRCKGLCRNHYMQAFRARRIGNLQPSCGHCGTGYEVSWGRCWDCHLAFLRQSGPEGEARAERLIESKRLHDEGRFDLDAMCEGMVDVIIGEYARGVDSEYVHRGAVPLRHGRPDATS